MKTYVGIDPGDSGAAVALCGPNVYVQPFTTPAEMRDFLESFQAEEVVAVLEEVGAMPLDGRASLAKFMKNAGGWQWLLTALRIPFDLVKPQAWQKALGLSKTKEESKSERKRRLKARAQELFPGSKITLQTADAHLIAEMCRRQRNGVTA